MTTGTLVALVSLCSMGPTFAAPGPDDGVVLAAASGTPVRVAVPTSARYASLSDSILSVVADRFEVLASAVGTRDLQEGDTFRTPDRGLVLGRGDFETLVGMRAYGARIMVDEDDALLVLIQRVLDLIGGELGGDVDRAGG